MSIYRTIYITPKGKQRAIKLYSVWVNLKQRCTNKNVVGYKYWGGRGISFCSAWDDFKKFRKWALSTGYRKGLQIDRIDNDGNYEPSNCRWATRIEQRQNQRPRKLTQEKVDAIRKDKRKHREIAEDYDMSLGMVSLVQAWKTWK